MKRSGAKIPRIILAVFLAAVFAAFVPLSGGPALCLAQSAGGSLEHDVKAAYVLNILKFVDWETEKLPAGAPIKIVIAGSDPISDSLEKHADVKIGGRSLSVVKVAGDIVTFPDCQLLYIARSEKTRLADLLKNLKGSHVLTVSDIPDFSRQGGIVGFAIENGRVKIEINVNESKRAGLKFGAKLLEVARLIK